MWAERHQALRRGSGPCGGPQGVVLEVGCSGGGSLQDLLRLGCQPDT